MIKPHWINASAVEILHHREGRFGSGCVYSLEASEKISTAAEIIFHVLRRGIFCGRSTKHNNSTNLLGYCSMSPFHEKVLHKLSIRITSGIKHLVKHSIESSSTIIMKTILPIPGHGG